MKTGSLVTVLALAALALPGAELRAQPHLGAQLNIADDVDVGIGGRIGVEIPEPNLEFAGSVDIFFPDDRGGRDVDYWELNANLLYFFELSGDPVVFPYAGGGLNIARIDIEDDPFPPGGGGSDTDAGLNLLGGVRFRTSASVKPFAELRVELGGGEQVVLTGGLLFF